MKEETTDQGHEAKIEAEVEYLTQTPLESEEIAALPQAHKDYLLSRHGTLDLDPIPDMIDADPYNWPQWKKVTNLFLVAFHAMMSTFTAAAIQSAFGNVAADFNISIQRASYLTSLVIAVLGGAPLFWRPFSDRYGRRPIFIISLIFSLVGNIGCAKSPTYGTMALCRAITGFFISPAAAIGSGIVAETFFQKERGRYMGVWTVMVTLGVPVAPLIFGFVALRVGYRWIYWVLAMVNAVQLILYLFLGRETRYIRGTGVKHQGFEQQCFHFGRIDPTPLSLWDFIQPLSMVMRPCVLIPAVVYAMIFLLAGVMITVEVPQLFGPKFGFNTQQLGLQFIAVIIGSLIGEQMSGALSDYWMNRRKRKVGVSPQPEFRLWLSYPGELLAICGVVVFLVRIDQAPALHWNVTPLVGAAIASVGNQIVTTVMITYAVDCYREEAASVGVFITFVRQMWGFIGPFWFPPMFTNIGLLGSAGLATGLMVAVSLLPTVVLQWKGQSLR